VSPIKLLGFFLFFLFLFEGQAQLVIEIQDPALIVGPGTLANGESDTFRICTGDPFRFKDNSTFALAAGATHLIELQPYAVGGTPSGPWAQIGQLDLRTSGFWAAHPFLTPPGWMRIKVSVDDASGTTVFTTFSVFVGTPPTVAPVSSPLPSVCENDATFDLNGLFTVNPGGATTTFRSVPAHNGLDTLTGMLNPRLDGPGNYAITCRVRSGPCVVTTTANLQIRDIPEVIPELADLQATLLVPYLSNGRLQFADCNAANQQTVLFAFTPGTGSNFSQIVSATLNYGDGSPTLTSTTFPFSPNPQHTYGTGNYEITLTYTLSNGCVGVLKYNYYLGTNPAGVGSLPGNSVGLCLSNGSVDITIALWDGLPSHPVSNNEPSTQYIIQVNDGSPDVVFSHPPPTTYTHTFTTSSCGATSPTWASSIPANAFGFNVVASNPCTPTGSVLQPVTISSPGSPGFETDNVGCVNVPHSVVNTGNEGSNVSGSANLTCTPTKFAYRVRPLPPLTAASNPTVSSGTLGTLSTNPFTGVLTGVSVSASQSLSLNFPAAGSYRIVQYVFSQGCGSLLDSISEVVCIEANQNPGFTLSQTVFCLPSTLQWTSIPKTGGCIDDTVWFEFINPLGSLTYTLGGSNGSLALNNTLPTGTWTVRQRRDGPCGLRTTNQPVVISRAPTLTLPPDTAFCGGGVLNLNPSLVQVDLNDAPTSSALWTISPSNGYQFVQGTATTLHPQIDFQQTGVYQVQLSITTNCGTVTKSFSVDVIEPPVINGLANASVCYGTTLSIQASAVSAHPPLTFAYRNSAGGVLNTNAGFSLTNLTADTVLRLRVTDARGCSSDTTVQLLVPLPLNASVALDSLVVCAGSPIGVSGSVNGGTPPYNRYWTNAQGDTLGNGLNLNLPAGSDTAFVVYFNVRDALQCTATDSVYVVVPAPVTAAIPAVPVYCGGSIALNANVSGGTVPYTYQWTPSVGLVNPNVEDPVVTGLTVSTLYTLLVTDALGCTVTAQANVQVNPPMSLSYPPLDTLCPGDSLVLSGLLLTGGQPPYQIAWDPTSISNPSVLNATTLPLQQTTTLILNVTDASGCLFTEFLAVQVAPDLVFNGVDTLLGCGGDSVQMDLSALTGGLPPLQYQWTPSGLFGNPTAMQPWAAVVGDTTVQVEVTDAIGCSKVFDFVLQVRPQPQAVIGNLNDSLCGSSSVSVTGSASGGLPPYGFEWSWVSGFGGTTLGASAQLAVPGSNDTLVLRVTDASGCIDVQLRPIEILNSIAGPQNLLDTLVICSGDSVLISDPTLPPSQTPYFQSVSGPNLLGASSGSGWVADLLLNAGSSMDTAQYQIWSQDAIGFCASDTQSVVVLVHPVPSFSVFPVNSAVCSGDTFFYSLPSTAEMGISVQPLANGLITGASIAQDSVVDILILNGSVSTEQAYLLTPFIRAKPDCTGPSDTLRVTVNPRPQAQAGLDTVVCFGVPIALGDTAALSGLSYLWSPAGLVNNPTSSAPQVVLPTGMTSLDTAFVLEVTENNTGCIGRDTVRVEILALPIFSAGPDLSFCANDSVTVGDASATALQIDWQILLANGLSPVLHQSATWTISPDSATTYVISFADPTTGCGGTDTVIVAPIEPPLASFALPDSLCSPAVLTLTAIAQTGITSSWSINGVVVGSGDNVTTTVVNGSNIQDSVLNITLNRSALGSGCSDDTTLVVVLLASPLASLGSTTDSLCAGESLTLNNGGIAPPQSQWTWIVDTALVDTLHQGLDLWIQARDRQGSDTLIEITQVWTTPSGCSDSALVVLNVISRPNATFQLPSSACSPDSLRPTVSSVQSDWDYQWNISPAVPFSLNTSTDQPVFYIPTTTQAVTYAVQLVVANAFGCLDSTVQFYTVQPKPTASFVPLAVDSCGPLTVSFNSNSSSNTSDPGLILFWDFGQGDTASAAAPVATFAQAMGQDTVYPVQLVAENIHGCRDTAFSTVTVHPDPIASIDTIRTRGCAPFVLDSNVFEAQSFPLANQLYTWQVIDSNGLILNTFTGITPQGSYTLLLPEQSVQIRLIATSPFGCASDTAVQWFQSVPDPVASFTLDSTAGCSPLTVVASDTTNQILQRQWFLNGQLQTGGGATEGFTLVNNGQADSVVVIRLTVTDPLSGCSESDSAAVTVFAAPTTVFTASPSCFGDSTFFADASQAPRAINQWLWDFGDGATSTLQNPVHYYNAPGVYVVQLTVADSSSCPASQVDTLIIRPLPVADIGLNYTCRPEPICRDSMILFLDSTVVPSLGGMVTGWSWDVDNNNTIESTNDTFSYVPNASGTFFIRLTVETEFGCVDSVLESFEVVAPPNAALILDTDTGCGPLITTAIDVSTGYILDRVWNAYALNGSGQRVTLATSADSLPPPFVFPPSLFGDTLYYLELVVSNCCGQDTQTRPILVYPAPVAGIGIASGPHCSPAPVQMILSGQVLGASDSVWIDFGDGSPPRWEYPIPPSPVNLPPWDTVVHNYLYNGTQSDTTYYLTLVAFNECGSDTIVDSVVILPNTVQAFFTHTPTSGCAPLTVQVNDLSYGGTNRTWCFNFNPNTQVCGGWVGSAAQTSFTYTQAGTYTIALIIDDGCSRDTALQQVTIHPQPTAAFAHNGPVCLGDSVLFVNNSTISSGSINQVRWRFGDGDSSTIWSVGHVYAQPGEYAVELELRSALGCISRIWDTVVVHPRPLVDFSFTNNVCLNEQPLDLVNLSTLATGNLVFTSWNFGDGNGSAQFQPIHSYAQPGTYTIELIHGSDQGCYDTLRKTIQIDPIPMASFTAIRVNPDPCEAPQTWNFTNTSSGAIGYEWYFNALDTSSTWISFSANPTFTFTQPGSYLVRLVAFNGFDCSDTAELLIELTPYPVAYFGADVRSGCDPLTVNFSDSTQYNWIGPGGIVRWTWDFGDGQTSSTQNPQHTYSQPGLYNVTLIVETNVGCWDTITRFGFIEVHPTPTADFTMNSYIPNVLETQNTTQTADPNTSYLWTFGNGENSTMFQPIYTYPVDPYGQNYSYEVCLTAMTSDSCSSSECQIFMIYGFRLNIPNAFTPELDERSVGNATIFKPEGHSLETYHLQVFDTWGNLVFETREIDNRGVPSEAWRGINSKNGSPLPMGAYVWKIEATFRGGIPWRGMNFGNGKIEKYGTVTLIR